MSMNMADSETKTLSQNNTKTILIVEGDIDQNHPQID